MWRDEIRELAARQHGAVAGHQVAGMGLVRSEVRRELDGHAWSRAAPRVWVLNGSVATVERSAMVRLLAAGPGAVLSHHAAAALWGVPGFTLAGQVHVSRCRGSNGTTPDGVIVHRVRRLPAHQITVLAGFPVVRPERIPFELAATAYPKRVERVIDDLWSRRLVDGRSLHRVLDELSARGRPGLGVMGALLAERPADWVPPASGLEGRVADQLRTSALPPFDRQVELGGDRWAGRVDFCNRQHRLVLEVQSDRYHAALGDRRTDERRHAALRAAGWTVIEVWESEIWTPGSPWLERIRRHLAAAA